MPRSHRIVVPKRPHNVWFRGNNRRRLFTSIADRLLFLRCLERGLRDSECELHQLSLMTNHVHLIAVPPNRVALSVLVARTCQRYAQRRNAAREASGKLFEERYGSKVIQDDQQLMTTTLYNDANAFHAGYVDTPFGHVWSTGPLHAGLDGGRIAASLWTPSPWYRGLGATDEARALAYRELITAYAAAHPGAGRDVDDGPYRLRLERPDRSLAREVSSRWPRKSSR